ncbi:MULTISPECIES: hypothetical protein [Kribbella]|uniref:Surface-anchored protein n=1 Tax=Kribbella karoonensis TaxID=324851 RepID=A0ABP4PHY2_9ACTN
MNFKKILNTKTGRLAVAGVIAASAVLGVSIAANAAGGTGCKTLTYPLCARSVASTQVVDNSLTGADIKTNSLGWTDLDGNTQAQIRKGDGKGGATKLYANATPTVIKNIGGTFSTRHTEVGTFTLPKGTWLVNLSAKFNRTAAAAAGAPEVQPMLQLVGGTNYVTIGGNNISPALDADLFGSAVGLVTVTEDTKFTVNAFGYASDRSDAGSGDITVLANVVVAAA